MSYPYPNSQAEILQALLIALGLGTSPPVGSIANNVAWPVYATSEPNEPDNCITVYDTANQTDMRDMYSGNYFRHYGFQVRVRSQDHPTGYRKMESIAEALATQVGGLAGPITVAIGSENYAVLAIVKIGGTLVLGKDTPRSKRSLFICNCLLVLGTVSAVQKPLWLAYLLYLGYENYASVTNGQISYLDAFNNI